MRPSQIWAVDTVNLDAVKQHRLTEYYDSSHALRQQISKSAILNFTRAIACPRSGIRFLNLLNIFPRWRHLCAVTFRRSFFFIVFPRDDISRERRVQCERVFIYS